MMSDAPRVLAFSAISADSVSIVGGKAASLGDMSRAAMPVPPGFCVTTSAYDDIAAALELAPLVAELAASESENSPRSAELGHTLRARLAAASMPQGLSEAVASAYRDLGDALPAVAVRSSATAEDLPNASFAGQQDTYLHVVGTDAVVDAVRRCWASLWNDRAIRYRAAQRIDHRAVRLAVVVQRMVEAEVAGVFFTANPVTGKRHQTVIDASYGLGEAVVSGLVNPDYFVVEQGTIGERHLGDKRLAIRQAPAGGTIQVELPDGRATPCLTDHQVLALAELGRQVEHHYGTPQDVEFAFDPAGRLWLLQTRPITALPPEPGDTVAPVRRVYGRGQRVAAANIRDRMPFAFHPFDYSLFARPMLTRMVPALPYLGFSPVDPDDMLHQAADGVYQIIPPKIRPTLRTVVLPFKIMLAALRANPEKWMAECHATLVPLAEETERTDLAQFTDAALLDRIETIGQRVLTIAPTRFANLPGGLIVNLLFPKLLRLAVGTQAPDLERDLLAAIPCVSFQANREIARLAEQIRASDGLRRMFLKETPDRIPELLADSTEGQALLATVDEYLARFGLRETVMLAAAHPAWRDDPRFVYRLLKGLLAAEPDESAVAGDTRVEVARRELGAAVARRWLGLGRWLFLPLVPKLLEYNRYFIAFREDSHYFLFMPGAVTRRLALELGRRFVTKGILESPADLFFLRIDEIKNLLADRRGSAHEVVRRRKAARGPGDGRFASVPADLLGSASGNDEIRGEPASSGQAVGRVRIVLRVDDFDKLQQGEVLVAPFTNPTWTPLFRVASAVVVDAGNAGSHAAIVARECQIPAVMGVGNATRVLQDGQRVLVDGDRGRVMLLASNTP